MHYPEITYYQVIYLVNYQVMASSNFPLPSGNGLPDNAGKGMIKNQSIHCQDEAGTSDAHYPKVLKQPIRKTRSDCGIFEFGPETHCWPEIPVLRKNLFCQKIWYYSK